MWPLEQPIFICCHSRRSCPYAMRTAVGLTVQRQSSRARLQAAKKLSMRPAPLFWFGCFPRVQGLLGLQVGEAGGVLREYSNSWPATLKPRGDIPRVGWRLGRGPVFPATQPRDDPAPRGALLLVMADGQAAGCCTLRPDWPRGVTNKACHATILVAWPRSKRQPLACLSSVAASLTSNFPGPSILRLATLPSLTSIE